MNSSSMAGRKQRQTFNILVNNLPASATEKEVSKAFTKFGEIQSITVRRHPQNKKSACIKFLCEPDADRACEEYNGTVWDANVISVKKFDPGSKEKKKTSGKQEGVNSQSYALSANYPKIEPSFTNYKHFGYNSYHETQKFKPKKPLASPEERDLICTYVENAVTFFGHRTSRLEAVEEMASLLQQCCPFMPRLNKPPDHRKVYAGLYSGDHMWHRCKVLSRRQHGKVLVQYIDFGNTEEIPHYCMVELPDHLRKPPAFAPKCVISSLSTEPTQKDKSLSVEAVEFLQQILFTKVVTISTLSAEDSPVYEVQQCSCDGQDIIALLLQKEYVVKKPSREQSVCRTDAGCSSSSADSAKEAAVNLDTSSQQPAFSSQQKGSAAKHGHLQSQIAELRKERDILRAKLNSAELKYKNMERKMKSNEEIPKYRVLKKMESLIRHIQRVNSIRKAPAEMYQDQSCISIAIDLLRSVSDTNSRDLLNKIDESLSAYRNCCDVIRDCPVKGELEKLISNKNSLRESACIYLNEYLSSPESSSSSLISVLKDTASNLKSLEKTKWNLILNEEPSSLEELTDVYNSLQEHKSTLCEEASKRTNAAHAEFIKEFSQIIKAFHLVDTNSSELHDDSVEQPICLSPEGLFSSESFCSSVASLESALMAEISISEMDDNSHKSRAGSTVVGFLLNKVSSVLETCTKELELREKYSSVYKQLSNCHPPDAEISDLIKARKAIKNIKSRLRHKLADKKDLEETDVFDEAAISQVNADLSALLMELHVAFVAEDYNMERIAKLYEGDFPEIESSHSEFGIAKYSKTLGLLKQSWEAEHFCYEKMPERIGTCYKSVFCGEPVIIKELILETEDKEKSLLDVMVKWNSLPDCVHPISAAFKKGERQMSVMMPFVPTAASLQLSHNEKKELILDVVKCLTVLHSNDVVHGLVHPSTVLVEGESVKLDFCFDARHILHTVSLNGINYQAPELSRGGRLSKASDMYAFGCFALWVFFPELEFSTLETGCPNVAEHRAEIEKELSGCDYSILHSLVGANPVMRAPANALLKFGFLSKNSAPSEEEKKPMCSDQWGDICAPVEEDSIVPPMPDAGSPEQNTNKSNLIDAESSSVTNHEGVAGKDRTLSRLFALRETIKRPESSAVSGLEEECNKQEERPSQEAIVNSTVSVDVTE